MNTHSLTASVLALTAAAAALTACTTEAEPSLPRAGIDAPPSPVVAGVDPAAALEVDDQKSQGPTVNVKAAALTKGGFVVVFGDDGRNTLGFGTVPAGGQPSLVQVSLAEEITKETELVARLYTDDDGDGLFSAADRPVSNGKDDADDDVKVFPGEQDVFAFTGKPVINN